MLCYIVLLDSYTQYKDPKVPECSCKAQQYYCHKRQLQFLSPCPLSLSQTVEFCTVEPVLRHIHIHRRTPAVICSHLHTAQTYCSFANPVLDFDSKQPNIIYLWEKKEKSARCNDGRGKHYWLLCSICSILSSLSVYFTQMRHKNYK